MPFVTDHIRNFKENCTTKCNNISYICNFKNLTLQEKQNINNLFIILDFTSTSC